MQQINLLLSGVLPEKFMHFFKDCQPAMENSGWCRASVNLLSFLHHWKA
jgi:hypothetical protein